jgi:acylphosphatase
LRVILLSISRGLRETIELLVKKPRSKFSGIHGYVHNLKDGNVEVICKGDKVELLYDQLCQSKINRGEKSIQTEEELKKYEFKDVRISEAYHDEADSFTDFTVERADDLSEMVLALRGAGYRFVESTATLERIHKSLMDRDNRLMESRLVALHHELLRIIDEFAKSEPDRNKLRTQVIESHVVTPVNPKEEFVNHLMIVSGKLQEFTVSPGGHSATWMDDLRNDLDELRKMVDEELDKIRRVKI